MSNLSTLQTGPRVPTQKRKPTVASTVMFLADRIVSGTGPNLPQWERYRIDIGPDRQAQKQSTIRTGPDRSARVFCVRTHERIIYCSGLVMFTVSTYGPCANAPIYGEDRIQAKLQGCRRNADIFDEIAARLREHGYIRTGEQCRTKMKNLRARYKEAFDNNHRSGRGLDKPPFYDELDRIFADRPSTRPTFVVDTLQQDDESGGEDDGESLQENGNDGSDTSRDSTRFRSSTKAHDGEHIMSGSLFTWMINTIGPSLVPCAKPQQLTSPLGLPLLDADVTFDTGSQGPRAATTTPYATALTSSLRTAFRCQEQQTSDRQKAAYDRTVCYKPYAVGDRVWLHDRSDDAEKETPAPLKGTLRGQGRAAVGF
ncbi:hypothetical protein Bbelb_318790 [Branchiostoma belcheri]|nr:hypothetical protein Bbelb_318790 [Branchiostoma belcheri]